MDMSKKNYQAEKHPIYHKAHGLQVRESKIFKYVQKELSSRKTPHISQSA